MKHFLILVFTGMIAARAADTPVVFKDPNLEAVAGHYAPGGQASAKPPAGDLPS